MNLDHVYAWMNLDHVSAWMNLENIRLKKKKPDTKSSHSM